MRKTLRAIVTFSVMGLLTFCGLGLVAIGGMAFTEGLQERHHFAASQKTILLNENIDISVCGKKSFTFFQEYPNPHGGSIELELAAAGAEADGKLDGLSGTFTVSDERGESFETEFTGDRFLMTGENQAAAERYLYVFYGHALPSAPGKYTLTMEVDGGAAALGGTDQVLIVRYHSCGLERLVATVGFAIGAAATAVGAAIILAVVYYIVRKRRNRLESPVHITAS